MSSNILNGMNSILESAESDSYNIKELTVDDILSMPEYSMGIKKVVSALLKFEYKNNVYFEPNDKDKSVLYRASSDKNANFFLYTPGKRISKGTLNVYSTLISDILPSWRNLPKRNRSVIYINDYYISAKYLDYKERSNGTIYVVIPPNIAKLVVASDEDVWFAFNYLTSKTSIGSAADADYSIIVFLTFFYNFVKNKNLIDKVITLSSISGEVYGILNSIKANEDLLLNKFKNMFVVGNKSAIVKVFKEIDKILSNKEFVTAISRIYSEYTKAASPEIGEYIIKTKIANSNISILDILDDLFDPVKNEFEVIRYEYFVNGVWNSHEIWTDSPCIFIDTNSITALTSLYNKYNDLK